MRVPYEEDLFSQLFKPIPPSRLRNLYNLLSGILCQNGHKDRAIRCGGTKAKAKESSYRSC